MSHRYISESICEQHKYKLNKVPLQIYKTRHILDTLQYASETFHKYFIVTFERSASYLA